MAHPHVIRVRLFRHNGEQVLQRRVEGPADEREVAASMYHTYMGDNDRKLDPQVTPGDVGWRVGRGMRVTFEREIVNQLNCPHYWVHTNDDMECIYCGARLGKGD